jgi:hypothetical protein
MTSYRLGEKFTFVKFYIGDVGLFHLSRTEASELAKTNLYVKGPRMT